MSRKVFIFDTTLRDGEQSPGASLNTAEKMEIARQLAKLNVDIIEAGFPASSQGDSVSVKQIAEMVVGPIICALSRAIEKDIVSAGEALKDAKKSIIHTFIGTSDIQVFDVLKRTRVQVLQMAIEAVKLAKTFCNEVEFSAMDATRTDIGYLRDVVAATIEAGATIINIPDTVGCIIPAHFGQLISHLCLSTPEFKEGKVRVSVHCHDDLGLATANSITAVMNGATQIECTVNGMGERAGNTALEEVVATIKVNGHHFGSYTEINTKEFADTSKLVSRTMGFVMPRNKPVAGENAFRHSSGIHQDGELKKAGAFGILKPEEWGFNIGEAMVLTSRSGRHGLRHRLSELGYSLSDEQLNRTYERFLTVADKKKQIFDEDLLAILEDELPSIPSTYSLDYIQISSGTRFVPTATIGLRKGDEVIQEAAYGDGPVDAAYKAIDKITGVKVELVDYSISAATKGKDAMGEVTVRIRQNGRLIIGHGASTDIIEASAKAYLNAINKLVAEG